MSKFLKAAIIVFLILSAVCFWLYVRDGNSKMLVPFVASLLCAAVEWWTLKQWMKC